MDKAYLLQYLEKYPFPAAAVDALVCAFDAIGNDEAMLQCMRCAVAAYEGGIVITRDDMLVQLFAVREQAVQCRIPSETVEVLFFLLCTKHLKMLYTKKQLPMAYYDGLASDIISKLNECHAVKGIWGSFVATWFAAFFTLDRFAIGRLQYDIIPMPACVSMDGKYCFNGEQAVNVHIPSGRPLLCEQVRTSMREATAFFADRFEGETVLFTCHSWLLFPGHYKMLPEQSNIRQFMEEFTLIGMDIHPDGKDLWRIFGTMDTADAEKLPQVTSLQKYYVNWLKAGKPVGAGLGIRYMAKKRLNP